MVVRADRPQLSQIFFGNLIAASRATSAEYMFKTRDVAAIMNESPHA